MRHLIICREFPPAAYAPGGIGTYVENVATALVRAGETVHVIGQQWRGAPDALEARCDGRLVIHRVPLDRPIRRAGVESSESDLRVLGASIFRAQAWAWNATLLAESLIASEGIELVEAQEYEGPLHFFLLRRALGLGPSSTPPCVVHLHSPSEFIWEHNDWDPSDEAMLAVRRCEEYCIAAADALLCPSGFLARQVSRRYGIALREITVIPYPMGNVEAQRPTVARSEPRRVTGPILMVGRIEARKGVLEWVDAAVAVAEKHPELFFDFVGADVRGPTGSSTLADVRRRIPRRCAQQFRFIGSVSRAEVGRRLAEARLAVVPSRWENFPNTCIEAMAAGVPLLVSPSGGMAEVVVDGVSGWIAASQTSTDLEGALRRALEASDSELVRMGESAALAIRAHCGDDVVIRQQLAFRRAVVARGARRSRRLPATLPWAGAPMRGAEDEVDGSHDRLAPSFRARPQSPLVVLHADSSHEALTAAALDAARRDPVGAVVVTAPGFVGEPGATELAAAILAAHEDVALIAGWVDARGVSRVPPSPAFPYQWLSNDLWPVAVVRARALLDAGEPRWELGEPACWWDTCNAILALGYRAVTVPARLAREAGGRGSRVNELAPDDARVEEVRYRVRQRFPSLVARDATALAVLAPKSDAKRRRGQRTIDRWTGIAPGDILRLSFRDQWALARALLGNPRRAIGWVTTRVHEMLAPSGGDPDR